MAQDHLARSRKLVASMARGSVSPAPPGQHPRAATGRSSSSTSRLVATGRGPLGPVVQHTRAAAPAAACSASPTAPRRQHGPLAPTLGRQQRHHPHRQAALLGRTQLRQKRLVKRLDVGHCGHGAAHGTPPADSAGQTVSLPEMASACSPARTRNAHHSALPPPLSAPRGEGPGMRGLSSEKGSAMERYRDEASTLGLNAIRTRPRTSRARTHQAPWRRAPGSADRATRRRHAHCLRPLRSTRRESQRSCSSACR